MKFASAIAALVLVSFTSAEAIACGMYHAAKTKTTTTTADVPSDSKGTS